MSYFIVVLFVACLINFLSVVCDVGTDVERLPPKWLVKHNIVCPSLTVLSQKWKFELRKYNYFARQNFCSKAGKGDNWRHLNAEDHARVAQDIFANIPIKSGDVVFEWGSGCGSKLRHLEENFDSVLGFGIDISLLGVRYACDHVNKSWFCPADGSDLSWLQDKTFSHSFAFGALHHIFQNQLGYGGFARRITQNARFIRNQTTSVAGSNVTLSHKLFDYSQKSHGELCRVLAELVRVTRIGGVILIGCNLWEPPQEYYQWCFKNFLHGSFPDLTMEILVEDSLHRNTYGQLYWGEQNIYRVPKKMVYTVLLRRTTRSYDDDK